MKPVGDGAKRVLIFVMLTISKNAVCDMPTACFRCESAPMKIQMG